MDTEPEYYTEPKSTPTSLDDLKDLLEGIIELNIDMFRTVESLAERDFEKPTPSTDGRLALALIGGTAIIMGVLGICLWIILGK